MSIIFGDRGVERLLLMYGLLATLDSGVVAPRLEPSNIDEKLLIEVSGASRPGITRRPARGER